MTHVAVESAGRCFAFLGPLHVSQLTNFDPLQIRCDVCVPTPSRLQLLGTFCLEYHGDLNVSSSFAQASTPISFTDVPVRRRDREDNSERGREIDTERERKGQRDWQ